MSSLNKHELKEKISRDTFFFANPPFLEEDKWLLCLVFLELFISVIDKPEKLIL